MIKINDLELGFPDAENYRRRENKEFLNQIFIRNNFLDKLCEPSTSFLIGEKGTGKTVYAVYLVNNNYRENSATIKYIRETEYIKFIAMKKEKHLDFSDYSSIWKVILYLLIAEQIIEKEGMGFLNQFNKLKSIKNAIDEYYNKAFSPEIIQALEFVKESKIGAELFAKFSKVSGEQGASQTFTESRFQSNLFYIQKHFEDAFRQVRLKQNYILFIDGIDIRPSSIPFNEYLDCIKGLANAIWEVNNDFFPSIKGGQGRIRAVLLIRPDIFQTLGLHNQNSKVRDNSVFLDWRTEYANHRTSNIFQIIDHLLESQQDSTQINTYQIGKTWDTYFPWDAPNIKKHYANRTSFLLFLRWSYYRPRDILTMLVYLKEIYIEENRNDSTITLDNFENLTFKKRYSDYLLGEIKDHLTFYYKSEEYELFLKFFEYLNRKTFFTYNEYIAAWQKFEQNSLKNIDVPDFMSSSSAFLQFLYDLNIICYFEDNIKHGVRTPHVRWCFRERSYANISPKVKAEVTYQIFYGLQKALNVV